MADAVDQNLEIARAVARRNLNWTTGGAILVVLVLTTAGFAGGADGAAPPPVLFGSHVLYGLALFGLGPAATLLLTFGLGRLYIARLKTPCVGYGVLAFIAVLAVVAGYFVTTSSWMIGILLEPVQMPGAGSASAALEALGAFLAQAGAFGIMGLVVTGWVTIPLAILISIGAAAVTNREIARRIAARQAGERPPEPSPA